MGVVRQESSVLSVSWIPSEAVDGIVRLSFQTGVASYDEPPPDHIDVADGELDGLLEANRFRFANLLTAWIDVDDGRIVDFGHSGGGRIGRTVIKLGRAKMTFAAVPLPDLRRQPEVGDGYVRFVQTAGGRTGAPMPRHVRHPPFVQWAAPLAWTTLELILWADGRRDHRLIGSSPFPRHWIYDERGTLAAKSGLIDYEDWYHHEAFGARSPWGNHEIPARSTPAETAAERELGVRIMHDGRRPQLRRIGAGEALCCEGEPGSEVFMLLDGLLSVEVDGVCVAEVGPGAIVGERALLEEGRRTATVRAVTPCRVAVAARSVADDDVLLEVRSGHFRELDTRPEPRPATEA